MPDSRIGLSVGIAMTRKGMDLPGSPQALIWMIYVMSTPILIIVVSNMLALTPKAMASFLS